MEETKQPKTANDLYKSILAILPCAQFEEDNYGQIIIYTDLIETNDGTLEDFDPNEEENI
jgi:hypothetical protein